ncbi:hypothetical protein BDW59DRAFT_156181 [Aspergillus cavernicola]|uniref:EF-hand domain-containing protein n=1 Tax=Aspergillus cavernicola TaxID=176166 RepID=A0ABR4J2H7_9EURO
MAQVTESRYLANPDARVTDSHIYFLRGVLSNWHASPRPFIGKRALELCLSKFDALEVPHPAKDAISTRLIQSFPFRCGEQWMMALKAWLFERDSIPLGESVLDHDNKNGGFDSFTNLRDEMLSDKPLRQSTDPQRKDLWNSALCRIMRTNSPKSQKMLGRKVPNFENDLWTRASRVIVTAGCIARAEVDEELKGLYLASGGRVFVEGSRNDMIWSVGLDWKSEEILDEKYWYGMNWLGEAHNNAAKFFQGRSPIPLTLSVPLCSSLGSLAVALKSPMSGRPGIAEKRLSLHRFQQIPDNAPDTMHNPNDVTIDIPLTAVPSRGQTGARNNSTTLPLSPSGAYSPYGEAGNINTGEKGLDPSSTPPSSHGFGHRRRRVIDEKTGRAVDNPEDGTVTRMGRFYQSVLNFSIVTRYMIYIAPLCALIAIPIIVGATAAQDAKIGGVSLPWFFTWIEVVWVSLWVCKLVAKTIPFVFQFLSGIVNSGTRKYALILRNLEIPLTTVLWMIVSLVTFLPIMVYNPRNKADGDTQTKSWEKSVKNVLLAFLICSLIFLAEKTIVQLISISYHRKQFDARIKESKRHVYLVGVLYDASRSMFPMYCKEFEHDDAIISDSILAAAPEKGRLGHLRSSSSAPLRFIRGVGQNVGRFGGKITGALGDVAQEITGKQVFNSSAARSIVSEALERRRCTEALARRIWMSFVVEGREALFSDDLFEVLGAGKEIEAEESFMMLDRDGNGDISLDEIILAVSEIGRTRKALNHSMHDVDQAIHVLDNLLATVAFIICILVFISFVTSGFGTIIAAGATSLLSLSFVFATTAQEVLGSCIFLFVKHPFDIGDRVEIDGKPYLVERISLLFSVFRNVSDHRVTQIPNVVLNAVWIDNYSRSAAMREKLTIDVSFDTSMTEIQLLTETMEAFVRDKENSRDFQPDVEIDVVGVGAMDKLELTVSISHKSNWAIESVRATRRSKFMCALVAALRKIPVRAPGAAAPEETPAEDNDNSDDKPDSQPDIKRQPSTGEGMRRPTEADNAFSNSKSTGFDIGRSGSVQHRGAAAAAGTPTTSAYSESTLNNNFGSSSNSTDPYQRTHSPAHDSRDTETYRTSVPSPTHERHLSVTQPSLNRGASTASTGRRKAGATQPVSSSTESTLPSHLQAPQLQPSPALQQQSSNPYGYPERYQEQPEPSTQPLELSPEFDSSRTQHLPQVYEHVLSPSPDVHSPRDPRQTHESRRPYGPAP